LASLSGGLTFSAVILFGFPRPSIKKDDLAAIIGTQFHTPFIGFQIAAKYGLIDINNGLLPNLNPPNTGKNIHHFVVEINLLF
jgi:hypothetical protein